MGRHSLNHALGIAINAIITLALISSVVLLVRTLPAHKQAPLSLLLSGAELWLANVIVFALWYWRLDGGGPNVREKRREFSRSFVFPQMQIENRRGRFSVASVSSITLYCVHHEFTFDLPMHQHRRAKRRFD